MLIVNLTESRLPDLNLVIEKREQRNGRGRQLRDMTSNGWYLGDSFHYGRAMRSESKLVVAGTFLLSTLRTDGCLQVALHQREIRLSNA